MYLFNPNAEVELFKIIYCPTLQDDKTFKVTQTAIFSKI
jgi:hypothetical protein